MFCDISFVQHIVVRGILTGNERALRMDYRGPCMARDRRRLLRAARLNTNVRRKQNAQHHSSTNEMSYMRAKS